SLKAADFMLSPFSNLPFGKTQLPLNFLKSKIAFPNTTTPPELISFIISAPVFILSLYRLYYIYPIYCKHFHLFTTIFPLLCFEVSYLRQYCRVEYSHA